MDKVDIKIDLEKKKAAVKKQSQDFMILTADISSMDPLARAAHNMFRAAILQELGLVPPTETGGNQGDHRHDDGDGHGHDNDHEVQGEEDDDNLTQLGDGYMP